MGPKITTQIGVYNGRQSGLYPYFSRIKSCMVWKNV